MKSAAYYNEIDPFAAQWLRNLIAAGHIAPGDVDTRSITDVSPDDIRHYTQCHFFAGIGVWSYALRLAGWPDDRPVWTGSCPCQPFSAAGKGEGFADDRHLYPAWSNLIRECRPARIYGEQVEAAIRHGWIDLVQDDLEASGYAFGKVCLPAASVGAPHIRSRLWFMAHTLGDTKNSGCFRGKLGNEAKTEPQAYCGGEKEGCRWHDVANDGTSSNLAYADNKGLEGWGRVPERGDKRIVEKAGLDGWLADSDSNRYATNVPGSAREAAAISGVNWPTKPSAGESWGTSETICDSRPTGQVNGRWADADWLLCRDGKWRPVEPGTFPLADRVTSRVGRLRAYGNAIVPQVAAEIIKATM